MKCPYNRFNECDWENCAARMYVADPIINRRFMKVCAIAYNGGAIPNQITYMIPEQKVQIGEEDSMPTMRRNAHR